MKKSCDWLTKCLGPQGQVSAYVTPSFLRGTKSHYTPFLMGTLGCPTLSACLAIDMACVHLAVHPSIHVVSSHDHWVTCLNLCYTPASLEGTNHCCHCCHQLMLPPCLEGDWHRCCHVIITLPIWWTKLCGTLTIMLYHPWQQLVWTCQPPCLGIAACL
jgi:hypothetical protein